IGGAIGGGVNPPFSVLQNCAGGVPVGGSCVFDYSFTPMATGSVSGSTSFSFTSGAQTLSATINLSGNGVGTLADVAPASVDFGLVRLGDTASFPITVNNPGPLSIARSVGGGVNPPFSVLQNCAGGVPAGGSCAYTYSFAPVVLGAASGSTTFTLGGSSGASQNVPVALSGTGVAAVAQVSPTTIGF